MRPAPPPKFRRKKPPPGSRNGKGSKWIRPKRRRAIYERDGWRCFWCGADLKEVVSRHRGLDHIWPRSRGGTHHSDNLLTSCTPCNSRRSNWKPSERWLR